MDPLSIAISSLALLISFVSLWRTIRVRPRLLVSGSVGLQTHETLNPNDEVVEYREVTVSVRNRGDATAYDVTATVTPRNGPPRSRELPNVDAGDRQHAVTFVDADGDASGEILVTYKGGPRRGVRGTYGYEEP